MPLVAQDFARERAALVHSLEREGIRERRVLDAIGRVPRERFVPSSETATAYADAPLPIGEGQTISQPFVVARMAELLEVSRHHHVLEVGTGSGYQAAILAELAQDVVSVERRPALAETASKRLRELGYTNVRVVTGDASTGFAEAAPYDRIIVAAATPALHPELAAQCTPDGRIVAPVGDRDLQQLVVRHGDGREERRGAVRFVPLLGSAGFSDE